MRHRSGAFQIHFGLAMLFQISLWLSPRRFLLPVYLASHGSSWRPEPDPQVDAHPKSYQIIISPSLPPPSPSTLKRLRGNIATALPEHRPGACTTTLLAIFIDDQDPAILVRVEAILAWAAFWRSSRKDWNVIRRAWIYYHRLLEAKAPSERWYNVHGGLTTIIATLLDLQWSCDQPDKWVDDAGSEFQLTASPADTVGTSNAVAASVRRHLWAQASEHHLGGGCEEGIHIQPTQSLDPALKNL